MRMMKRRAHVRHGPELIDFLVLTGFLGSGKTTLLRDFLATPEAAETAVIVNEVGEIGLDGAILAESAGGLRMATLANGCVCCALGSDLADTVVQLVDSRATPLRRIVLETSGLSKPGPILRGLASLAALRLRVIVVSTFDCQRSADVAGFEEAAAQWAGAQALVLTKRDLATPEQMDAARAMARVVNPLADIIDVDDRRTCVVASFAGRPPAPTVWPGRADVRHAGSAGAADLPHRGNAGVAELPPRSNAGVAGLPPPSIAGSAWQSMTEVVHPRITVLLIRWTAKPAWDDFAAWLDNLAGLLGERLLRIKGIVAVTESQLPLLVQSVGTTFSAPRPFGGAADTPFLVVIARDTSLAEVAGVTPALPLTINRLGAPDPFARPAAAPLRAN
jgi:G3E family GTPase